MHDPFPARSPEFTVILLLLLAGLTANLSSASAATLEESLDAQGLLWTTGGAVPWFGQTATTHDGVDAAECGGLTNAWSESWLQTTVTGRVAVLFWWKSVSPGGSSFGFWFHTNDTYLEGLYGNVDWRSAMVSFAEGTNSLKWSSLLGGLNPTTPIATNWLDQVVVTNIAGLMPTFLTQPESSMILPENYPNETNLQVRAIGDIPMTYQWQRNGTNLTESWPFYGVTTPSFRFYARTAAEAGDYRVVLSNAWGMATSQVCSVSIVPAKPGFHPFQPADVVLAPGAYHSFNYVSILGTSPFTLQWLKDGSPIPNGNIGPATFADAGGYSLVVTNAYGVCTSRVAQVTVSTELPTIVTEPDPESTEAQPGDSVQFSMQASGPEPLSYSWRKMGEGTELATMNWFGFDSVDSTNTGFYYVIVANNNGAVTSRVCVLAVAPVTALGLALDVPQLTVTNHYDGLRWTPDGNSTNAHDGLCAARSPEMFFGSSAFSTVVSGPTNLSFWWRISAAPQVFLDIAVDGLVSNTISGELAWHQQGLSLPAGEHTLTWTFRKETAEVAGADAAWVDQLTIGGTNINTSGNTNEITAFTTSGDAPSWYLQTTNTHDGVSAWQSGAITDDQTNRLTATITGPGTLTFWWQVDSEENFDFLEFWLDGARQAGISGQTNWHQQTLVLGAGVHTLEWLYAKDGSDSTGTDAGWVDEVIFTPTIVPPTLAQALNATNLTFTTGGDAPWFVQMTNSHDGVMALQSGDIGDSQQSWVRTTVIGPGQLAYWYALSTEGAGDNFYLPWLGYTYGGSFDIWQQQIINIPDGTYTIEWLYEKDASGSGGSDAVWMDQVTWTPAHAGEPPVFVLQPTNKSVSVDQMLEVVVQAIGEQPITYTLLREGEPVQVDTVASSGPFTLSKWINSTNETGNYWVAATNAFGGATSAVAHVSVHYAATIYSSPSGRKLIKSRGFTLSVVANGEPPLAYQWFKNGTPISGARESALSVASSSYSDTADYVATVSNVWCTATSSVARVTVVPCFYTARNLGTLKSGTVFSSWPSEAFDINNVGEVVGWSVTDEVRNGELHHGFVWVNGSMIDLGDGRTAVNVAPTNRLPGSSCAYSINDNFDVVGYYEYRVNPSLDGYGHAAHWRGITCGGPPGSWGSHCPLELVDVHPRDIYMYPPDTAAVAINARRQILLEGGLSWTPNDYGYLLTPDDPYSPITGFTTRQLGVGVSGWITPYAMNHSGVIVGRDREFVGGDMPFLYDGTNKVGSAALTNLYFGVLRSVNDGGVIAGHYSTTSEGFNVKRPFLLYPDGRYEAPTNPAGGLWSFEVRDINNRNQVVGGNFANQGALYEDGQWFTLNDLLVDNLVSVTVANAINDRGQIVGVAWFPYTGYRACLLTPTTVGANQSPVAADDEYRLPEPALLRISTAVLLANDTDPDGDRLSVVALGQASATTTPTQMGGRASLQAGAIYYSPPAAPFATDQFTYTVSDGLGRQDTALLTIVIDPAAPAPRSIINAPQILPDGSVLLSGSGPVGAVVSIYFTPDVQASYWTRDSIVTVPTSGLWTATRPGQVGGRPAFYRAEISGQP